MRYFKVKVITPYSQLSEWFAAIEMKECEEPLEVSEFHVFVSDAVYYTADEWYDESFTDLSFEEYLAECEYSWEEIDETEFWSNMNEEEKE